ncbi:MAG TPA: HlyD family efflux transporter periplasmic adaptor subunit [Alphaproteobacteria bacterium]|jgi:multidrug resistance efflux pump
MKRFSLTRHGLPLIAAGALAFATYSVLSAHQPRLKSEPLFAPPASPFEKRVAGVGLVEPASETIAVATELGGVVARVHVAAGQAVEAGAPLFTIDDRAYRAALADAEASFALAEASIGTIGRQIEAQRALILQARAQLAGAEAEFARADADRARFAALAAKDWASRQKLEATRADASKAAAAVQSARAAVVAAERNLDVLEAQHREAEARRAAAAAKRDRARVDLDKTVIKAPIAGTVLRVNVRLGEYAPAGVLAEPLLALGATAVLHVRVDVDETDAWRVRAGAAAQAQLRGNAAIRADLAFVRFEPMVVPKRNLAGGAQERVDTRVLQILYRFDPAGFPARVGQQVDVFIAAPTGRARAGGTPERTVGAAERSSAPPHRRP